MEREPDFHKDIENYGKVGEKYFINHYGHIFWNKGYKIFDVSGIREWQKADVDYFIRRDPDDDNISFEHVINTPSFIKIEVKLDTAAEHTGNLPYEYANKGVEGWSVKTKADYVFWLLVREERMTRNQSVLYQDSEVFVDMNKWHDYVRRPNPNDRWFKDRCTKPKEDIHDYLCPINKLINEGLAVKKELPKTFLCNCVH